MDFFASVVPMLSVLVGLLTTQARAGLDLGYGDDFDLSHFVTRPEIKAPIMTMETFNSSAVYPGYLLVAPYVDIYQEKSPIYQYQPCQVGPHIYDNKGDLVWSGACLFRNRNMADFRASQDQNGQYQLSAIDLNLFAAQSNKFQDGESRGRGVVLNDAYQETNVIKVPKAIDSFNMHELKIMDGGKSALHILWKPEYVDIAELDVDREAGWVGNMGFREIDLATNKTNFEWWSLDHIPLSESYWQVQDIEGPAPKSWNYLHLDSVDKNANGDFLISARHTNCLYKISGHDHSVIWRLGGKFSSFAMDQSMFARQHGASFIEPQMLNRREEPGVEYISVFDNAADEYEAFSDSSSVAIIRVDSIAMTATEVNRVSRPDGELTLYSGNAHILPNGNLFTSWGGNNYLSEHTADGAMATMAYFKSRRFSNYRAYKSDWKAAPSVDELALKCFAHGTSSAKATTVCYVSWNGATEVDSWKFYYGGNDSRTMTETVKKDGFETEFHSPGYTDAVFVDALDSEGSLLGTSKLSNVERPGHWSVASVDGVADR